MKNISVFLSALVALLFSVAETSAQITPPYYNPANVRITGGTINGTTIGATTAVTGAFTTLTSNSSVSGTATATNATVGGAIGTSFQQQLVNTHITVGDWIGTVYRWIANDATTAQAYIGAVLTSSASNGLSDLVFGVKDAVGSSAVTEYMRIVGGGNVKIANGKTLQVGSGSTTSAGLIAGYLGASGYGAIWSTGVTPSLTNYAVHTNGASTFLNSTSTVGVAINNAAILSITSASTTHSGDMIYDKTITTAGTTGAVTINKTTGRVNFAAAATSLVVTNSLVTANSIVHCTVATNDTTMKSAACVPTAGSFTIYGNAAATAETAVAFTVTN